MSVGQLIDLSSPSFTLRDPLLPLPELQNEESIDSETAAGENPFDAVIQQIQNYQNNASISKMSLESENISPANVRMKTQSSTPDVQEESPQKPNSLIYAGIVLSLKRELSQRKLLQDYSCPTRDLNYLDINTKQLLANGGMQENSVPSVINASNDLDLYPEKLVSTPTKCRPKNARKLDMDYDDRTPKRIHTRHSSSDICSLHTDRKYVVLPSNSSKDTVLNYDLCATSFHQTPVSQGPNASSTPRKEKNERPQIACTEDIDFENCFNINDTEKAKAFVATRIERCIKKAVRDAKYSSERKASARRSLPCTPWQETMYSRLLSLEPAFLGREDTDLGYSYTRESCVKDRIVAHGNFRRSSTGSLPPLSSGRFSLVGNTVNNIERKLPERNVQRFQENAKEFHELGDSIFPGIKICKQPQTISSILSAASDDDNLLTLKECDVELVKSDSDDEQKEIKSELNVNAYRKKGHNTNQSEMCDTKKIKQLSSEKENLEITKQDSSLTNNVPMNKKLPALSTDKILKRTENKPFVNKNESDLPKKVLGVNNLSMKPPKNSSALNRIGKVTGKTLNKFLKNNATVSNKGKPKPLKK